MPFDFLTFVAATAIQASTSPPAAESPQIIEALAACQKETDDGRRLRCFDQAAAAVTRATSSGELVVVSRDSLRKTRRSLFGFLLPRNPLLDAGPKEEPEVREIRTAVVTARPAGPGRWRFELGEAGTWVTQETSSAILNPRPGTPVVLNKGALGGYFLTVQGRSVRAARVQ